MEIMSVSYVRFSFLLIAVMFNGNIYVQGACTSDGVDCAVKASNGACVVDPQYMMCHCGLECNTNSKYAAPGVARDGICQCGAYAARGLCEHGDGSLPSLCPHTCSLRQTVTCPVPPRYSHSSAVGGRRYLDRVVYVCAYGYRNTGNIGLRACQENGSWTVSAASAGKPPNCVEDASLQVSCNTSLVSFTSVLRTSVTRVRILDSKDDTTMLECADWMYVFRNGFGEMSDVLFLVTGPICYRLW